MVARSYIRNALNYAMVTVSTTLQRGVKNAAISARLICQKLSLGEDIVAKEQKQRGGFGNSDFNPVQLRIIYDQFENKLVDRYLDGKLSTRIPNLYSGLN